MDYAEMVDGLLAGDILFREPVIQLLIEGHNAIRAINVAKMAFTYVDAGDYGALSIVRSSIEECNVV